MSHPEAAVEINVAMKRAKAAELRAGGSTYREIAHEVGVTLSYAYQLVQETLTEIREHAQESADEARVIELQRLDTLYLRFRKKIDSQGDTPDEATGLQLLRISERRARLLGLDAPQEIGGPGGGPIPIQSSSGAGDAFMLRVESYLARLASGEAPDAIAGEIKEQAAIAASPATPGLGT